MDGVPDRVSLHDGAVYLNGKQRANVLMVLFVGQMLQVLLLALLVFVFFVGFGWVTMDSRHIAEWTGQPPENAIAFGHELGYYLGFDLDKKLFQVAIFLAAVSGFFFAVSSMTDDAYKEQFYARMNGELETAIQVRRVYLALYQGRHAAGFDDEDPAATHVRLRFPRPSNGRRWFEQTPYSPDTHDAYADGAHPDTLYSNRTYSDRAYSGSTYSGGAHLDTHSGGGEEPIQYPATEIES